MAYTIRLLEATPHRLRYAITSDSESSSATIVNRGNGTAVGHDLRDDSFPDSDTPMNSLVSTAVTNQAGARKLLDGQGLTTPASIDTPRAHVSLVHVNSETKMWGVDELEGAAAGDAASAGHAVIRVFGPNITDAVVILDIQFAHTEYR